MSKKGALAAMLLLSLAAFPSTAPAAEEGSTYPPTNLKKVGDHWTPWDPPTPGPDDYIIVKGDTLWDLAGTWLGDPYLWPQIWDLNRYILDSHWIYPGDPLVVPGKPTVVPPEGPPTPPEEPAEDTGDQEPEPAPAPTPIAVQPLLPVADDADVYCSGYVDPDHGASDVWIAGREIEREGVAEGDVVYLSRGRNQGIAAGDRFAVIRSTREVAHPETGQALGEYVRRLGRVRILAAQENTAIGVIEMSCEDIRDDDELVPWQEIPIPRMTSLPEFDRYDVTPHGDLRGYVVTFHDPIVSAGGGHIIQTDLGEGLGVRPGDVLYLYRDNADLPRMMIGQAVVLTVEAGTSTAKITNAVRELGVGDRVELSR